MPDKRDMFVQLIGSMAETGPSVRKELDETLGRAPSPGHLIDASMKLMAIVEGCGKSGDLERGMDAFAGALYLLRELAVSQNYIAVEPDVEA